ncbi:MAG: Qnr family pentapeptide repeat protein [Alteromonadaceae bacterium]|nr:Qnr family pentapeptide repeat protein [Alteromonadaceae bacterium]
MMNHQTYSYITITPNDIPGTSIESCIFIECDFSRADFSGYQFKNCNFIDGQSGKGCLFENTELEEASFINCNLSHSTFAGANLFMIEFRQCNLTGADFKRAKFAKYFTQEKYDCSAFITACNLSYANLENLRLEKCDLFENRWIGVNLHGAILNGSDLSRGVFSSDVWGAFSFSHADLSHVELEGLDPRKVNVEGVRVCRWQQEELLAAMGFELVND